MAEDVNLGSFSLGVRKICSRKDTRSHIEHDEDSITSGGASLEEHSVEYTRAKCTETNAESDTCTSPSSPSTDELKIMRNQGAIPKNFHKVLPPGPEPSPSKEGVLHNFNLLDRKSQAAISQLLKDMAAKKVTLERCGESGRLILVYEESSKKNSSVASAVLVPETDSHIQILVKESSQLIDSLKEKTHPVDVIVLLELSKIKLVDGKYREGKEFKKKGKLGKGGIAGWVNKVKDKQTKFLHCHKTVSLSSFNVEELQCLVDLRHTCYVPSLLMYRIRDVAVELHMELLTNSFTMEQVIQEKVCELGDLGKPFAYYILREMLMAMSVMQEKQWLHGDIHDKNIMVQLLGSENLALKLIDFGDAFQIKNAEMNDEDLKHEIELVMSIFCAVFEQICFNDVDDRTECLNKDRLVAFAVNAKNPFQSKELFDRVETQFDKSLKDLCMTKAEFLRQVVAVLSTGKSDDGATVREEEDDIKSLEGKVAVQHREKGDTNVKYIKTKRILKNCSLIVICNKNAKCMRVCIGGRI